MAGYKLSSGKCQTINYKTETSACLESLYLFGLKICKTCIANSVKSANKKVCAINNCES